MTKKHFIALADFIRHSAPRTFSKKAVAALADFLQSQNPRFKRSRWLCYVAGKCGPNGGAK